MTLSVFTKAETATVLHSAPRYEGMWGKWGVAPRVLGLGTTWRWIPTDRTVYTNRHYSRSERCKKLFLPPPWIERSFLGRSSRNLISIARELHVFVTKLYLGICFTFILKKKMKTAMYRLERVCVCVFCVVSVCCVVLCVYVVLFCVCMLFCFVLWVYVVLCFVYVYARYVVLQYFHSVSIAKHFNPYTITSFS
jgi:hypothetical protein